MPLQVVPLTTADIPAFADVDDAAMQTWPLARAMHLAAPPGQIRKDMISAWMRSALEHPEPGQQWLKVVDEELDGKLIAGGGWKFVETPEAKEGVKEEVPAPVTEARGPMEEGKEGPGRNGVWDAMRRGWTEFQAEWFADIPYANLQVLVTDPKHQHRGAGSLVLEWGIRKADEKGLVSVLQASPAGESLYLKHGFEVKRIEQLDLRPFGVDATEARKGMIRQPQPREAEK